jgi:carbon starvation protein
LIFNNRLDAVVTGVLVVMVALVLLESARQWLEILSGKKQLRVSESPFVMTQLAEEGQG